MDSAADKTALDLFGELLSAQALAIYLILFTVFAAAELVLPDRDNVREPGGKRNFVNFALGIAGMGLLALLPLGTVAAALLAQDQGWGLFNRIDAHPAPVFPAALLAQTFVLYWFHRASHRVPVLWRLHRVHHSDNAVDLSTGLRHHPVEALVTAPVKYAAVIALGLPVWAALLTDLVLFAGTLFKHLDLALPRRLDRALGLVFATPALHRFHHSSRIAETDSNFGNTLIVWDRLFGTLTPVSSAGPARLGLGDAHDRVADDLLWQLRLPLNDPPQ